MHLEIEAKFRVKDHHAIRSRLEQLDARRVTHMLEKNEFYDDASRSLMANDSGLRIRTMRDLDTGDTQACMTFKGPRLTGRVKRRPEHEVEFQPDDAASLRHLIEALGYQRQLAFEKRRERYRLNSCTIELDQLPQIGRFVEIEGPGEDPIMELAEQLDLADETMLHEGYAAMVSLYLAEHPYLRMLTFDEELIDHED